MQRNLLVVNMKIYLAGRPTTARPEHLARVAGRLLPAAPECAALVFPPLEALEEHPLWRRRSQTRIVIGGARLTSVENHPHWREQRA